MPVADVHPGGPDTDQHVIDANRRRGNLLEPQLITRDNVKTVVDDGQVKAEEICVAETAAACQELGISAS